MLQLIFFWMSSNSTIYTVLRKQLEGKIPLLHVFTSKMSTFLPKKIVATAPAESIFGKYGRTLTAF